MYYQTKAFLLYPSDAAEELTRVNSRGGRVRKKKKRK